MKNRLIYVLITSMVISLIGIIALQGIWISGAAHERERVFAAHVNDALNTVNDAIDEDEAVIFLDQEFGGLDSLLHDVSIIAENNKDLTENVVIINDEPSKTHSGKKQNRIEISCNVPDSDRSMKSQHQMMACLPDSFAEKLEIKLEMVDSALEASAFIGEMKEHRMDHITSVVKHFTFEQLFSGRLEDRITKKALSKKLKKALKKEGISSDFEFAIFNKESGAYEKEFISSNFDKKFEGKQFRKNLFPGDKVRESNFKLIVQPADQGSYIWNGISQMVILSVLFTILILLCFGYSLYFIFKQKKISQIKNDFINNMTHELKTPLASISLAAASIKHPQVIGEPKEIENFVKIIENEKDRMNAHIEQVLDIAALDKGELKLNFAETDLVKIIQKSLKNIDLPLTEAQGKCSFNHVMESAPLSGDEFHLINVITNILDNSIKYKNGAPEISIDIIQKDDSYHVTLKDNGIGMSGKSQKLAFDRFYRAETGNIHNIKGFGLGLSYAKSIIDAHHGSLALNSELNNGTTVTLIIPIKQ